MNHQKLQVLVSSYLDGEVSEKENSEVHEHLKVCSECREFVAHARLMRKEINALGEVKLPLSFTTRIAYSVEKKEEQTMEWLGIEPLARNTFILLAGFVVLLFFFTSLNRETAVSANDQLFHRITSNSYSNSVMLQQEHLSKSDLLYAVMTK
jgi:anti-sigma factor RsiW